MSNEHLGRMAVEPAEAPDWMRTAVRSGGATVVPPAEAEAILWAHHERPEELTATLRSNPHLAWVQLPWAGVEPYRDVIDAERLWTCGKGVYAEPVAELALASLLAGLRGVVRYARRDQWTEQFGTSLYDAKVTIIGGGGIATALIDLLGAFRTRVTVVRRHPNAMVGVDRVLPPSELLQALSDADGVVLALPVLPDTIGMIGREQLEAMQPHAWLVNVARGAHVVTNELLDALRAGTIGGAVLDVTDPEPLPAGHPLWSEPNCVITPHVGNTQSMAIPLLSARISDNVRRWIDGRPLIGQIDPALGY